MAARAQRSSILELAVLGLLHEAPLHGYELRKRLSSVLGTFHSISYGSLYPCLKDLVARGWIVEDGDAERSAEFTSGVRHRSPSAHLVRGTWLLSMTPPVLTVKDPSQALQWIRPGRVDLPSRR